MKLLRVCGDGLDIRGGKIRMMQQDMPWNGTRKGKGKEDDRKVPGDVR